jgi:hypothetical protein
MVQPPAPELESRCVTRKIEPGEHGKPPARPRRRDWTRTCSAITQGTEGLGPKLKGAAEYLFAQRFIERDDFVS